MGRIVKSGGARDVMGQSRWLITGSALGRPATVLGPSPLKKGPRGPAVLRGRLSVLEDSVIAPLSRTPYGGKSTSYGSVSGSAAILSSADLNRAA